MRNEEEQNKRKMQLRRDTKLTQQSIDVTLNSMMTSLKNIIEKYQWKLKQSSLIRFDHEMLSIEHLEDRIDEIMSAVLCMMDEMTRCKDDLQIQLKEISKTLSYKYPADNDRIAMHSVSEQFQNPIVEDLDSALLNAEDLNAEDPSIILDDDNDENNQMDVPPEQAEVGPILSSKQKSMLTESIIEMVHEHDDLKQKKNETKQQEFQIKILQKMQEKLADIRDDRVNGVMLQRIKRSKSHEEPHRTSNVNNREMRSVKYFEELFESPKSKPRAQSANPGFRRRRHTEIRRHSHDSSPGMAMRKVTVFGSEIKPKSARKRRRKSRHKVK